MPNMHSEIVETCTSDTGRPRPHVSATFWPLVWSVLVVVACRSDATQPRARSAAVASLARPAGSTPARLPLVRVTDIDLPGAPTRFDYQDIDTVRGRLVVAHMNDGAVLFVNLHDGSVLTRLTGIPMARGVAVAEDVARVFITSSPHQLVIVDAESLEELRRVETGAGPDGVAWDPSDKVVGVSDQRDGALSLINDSGDGLRTSIPLGDETGNVAFDGSRGWFWITVVTNGLPDQLVGIDPKTKAIKLKLPIPGCSGAHGLRLHPDGESGFIACEANNLLARVALRGGDHAVSTAATGSGPDVLAIDAGIGWLYVAAESGELTIFDTQQPGVVKVGHDHLSKNAHSVAVDRATHRVFFPIMAGPKGTPILRIMKPQGT
jgi:DNA-binding beta-propeller fold protein YncE